MIANLRRTCLVLGMMLLACGARAGATTIDFETGGGAVPLPYSEDGLTFANVGTEQAFVLGNTLFGQTNQQPINVKATAVTPFNLQSVFVISQFTTFQITTSAGGSIDLHAAGTVDTSTLPLFQNITFFDVVLNSGGTFQIDNVVINSVPEPATDSLLLAGFAALALAARRRAQKAS